MQTPRISMLLMALALCVLLAGCASSADTVPSPSPSDMNGGASPSASAGMPSASPTVGTGASVSPGGANNGMNSGMNSGMNNGANNGMNNGANSGMNSGTDNTASGNAAETLTEIEDVKKVSGDVRDAVGKLTEADEATVVAVNDYALVGVTYDEQYKSGLTDRLRDMILSRAKSADSRVNAVYVTDDETLIERIKALETALDTAQDTGTISAEADTLRAEMDRTE